jgi:hypothetical protein
LRCCGNPDMLSGYKLVSLPDPVRGDHTFEHPYVLPEKEDHQALHAYFFLFLLVLQPPLEGRRY